MRSLLILIIFAALLAPFAASAQGIPPVPRPRPDRGESMSTPGAMDAEPGMAGMEASEGTGQTTAIEAMDSAIQAPMSSNPPADGPSQPVTLSAKISEEGAIIPNGLVWRVFDTKTDSTGQLALLAKSEESVAVFNLVPGDYVLHVAYGRSQATDTIRVEPGTNSKILVLNSGALRLNAAISGDVPILATNLTFEIRSSGEGAQDRVLVADKIRPGELVHLNAGVYHIISYFGTINAQVKADLRVEPGELTDATLYHRASEIRFKLVSEDRGEAIADVDWTVKNPADETIYSDFGAFPATILAEGSYTVIAKRGVNVYNRDFQVLAGPSRQIEVLTTVY